MTPQTPSLFLRLALVAIVLLVALVMLERWAGGLTGPPDHAAAAALARNYLDARRHVLAHAWLYLPLVVVVPGILIAGFRRLAQLSHAWRERVAGMAFDKPSYALTHPFERAREGSLRATQAAFAGELGALPNPDQQVLLGLDERGLPVALSDRARTMHVHLLGQTGSGKTQSVIYPLLFQDAQRRRPLLFLDAKGSADNEAMFAAIAGATGRARDARLFSLNPRTATHTYNPVYMAAGSDPRQIAERVFSTFAPDMDNVYYRDMARELWVNLVCALASTGKQMTMLDLAAAIADQDVMVAGLEQASDRASVRAIQNRYAQLAAARKLDQTYTGLLAAVRRYDHDALNTYNPDIILEQALEDGSMIAFSLSANAYKFQARAVGLCVLQHLQHIGALRQMDRSRPATPLYVYADEFYTFAYEGFVDAVNKLRDAGISMLLSHQSLSDLERVSPEYARAIWDNTRNKIVLYQNDDAVCSALAASMGTRKNVELTVRRSVDGFLNQASALEASSREVDEFVLHPSQLKQLEPGQAYLVQAGVGDVVPSRRRRRERASAARVVGVNLALMQPLPAAALSPPAPADTTSGIGLHALFLAKDPHARHTTTRPPSARAPQRRSAGGGRRPS